MAGCNQAQFSKNSFFLPFPVAFYAGFSSVKKSPRVAEAFLVEKLFLISSIYSRAVPT
jgi:hypothetical protein